MSSFGEGERDGKKIDNRRGRTDSLCLGLGAEQSANAGRRGNPGQAVDSQKERHAQYPV